MKKKVLLICAGGMSTSILMKKLIKYAEEHGFTLKIEAVGATAYEDVYKNYDILLLGPQISYKKAEIQAATHMPVDVIAPYDYAIGNAENIFKQVDKIYPKKINKI
jgi:PTS system cellobiose-specific IIB component